METGANKILPQVNYSSLSNNLITEKCHLSIEISLTHIAFSILDKSTKRYEILKAFSIESKNVKMSCENILETINSDTLIRKEFDSTSITLANFPSTIIPAPLYKEKYNKEILSFNHVPYTEILSDEIHNMNAFNIYSIPKDLRVIIEEYLPNSVVKCFSSIFITQLISQDKKKEETVYATFNNKKLEIFILKEGQLIFHNIFSIDTKEDILYFVLFTYEQLNLSPEKTELVIFDDILVLDKKYKLLYEYIRNISFGKRPDSFEYSAKINNILPHQYFCLFSQVLCV